MSASSWSDSPKTLRVLDVTIIAYGALALLGAGLVIGFFQETVQNIVPILLSLTFLAGTWHIHLRIRDKNINRTTIVGWILFIIICTVAAVLIIFMYPYS